MTQFRVNEIFRSFQGEGICTGVDATFIRFSGCNLSCRFCDTSHEAAQFMDLSTIVDEVKKDLGSVIIITGGEPTIQEGLLDLISALPAAVAIETNGTNADYLARIVHALAFVSVSPKSIESLDRRVLGMCNEVKIVIGEEDPRNLINSVLSFKNGFPIWLQPESNEDSNLIRVMNLVKEYKNNRIRVGHQMHKIRGWR